MPAPIATDTYSARMRDRVVRPHDKRVLISRIAGSEQETDLSVPPNCDGFGRVRHFRRHQNQQWPSNPLPIDPASRALQLRPEDELRAQVFQLAACNWRCWYCFVPFELLSGRPSTGNWFTADELLDLYLAEATPVRPRMIDLTGGQPDLVPEWVLWTMQSIRGRGLEGSLYLWSDDNLSNDYFWTHLSDSDRDFIAGFNGYGRVACFKGFDSASFAFNTDASPELFERQFDLFKRLLSTGIDLYAYVTLTCPDLAEIAQKIRLFVDRLQGIHDDLPLRTIPLQVARFRVVESRLTAPARSRRFSGSDPIENQLVAVDCWRRELEDRYSADRRATPITDLPLR